MYHFHITSDIPHKSLTYQVLICQGHRGRQRKTIVIPISLPYIFIYIFFTSIFISIPINLYSSTHIVRGDHEGDNEHLCSRCEIFLRYASKYNIYMYTLFVHA